MTPSHDRSAACLRILISTDFPLRRRVGRCSKTFFLTFIAGMLRGPSLFSSCRALQHTHPSAPQDMVRRNAARCVSSRRTLRPRPVNAWPISRTLERRRGSAERTSSRACSRGTSDRLAKSRGARELRSGGGNPRFYLLMSWTGLYSSFVVVACKKQSSEGPRAVLPVRGRAKEILLTSHWSVYLNLYYKTLYVQ